MRILAVDDEKIALSLLAEALISAGYDDVELCQDPNVALDLIRTSETPFDCFLFDIQMPGLDGIELCREVRAVRRYERTPIIMVTALSEKTHVDKAFAAGATDYLTKPFDPLEVGARVGVANELINERKTLDESTDVIERLIGELDRVTSHELDVPIELGKVDRLLSYPAFENYLFELSRGVFFLCGVFAVTVRDIEFLHDKLPPLEFKQLLTRAAAHIVSPLRAHEVFLAYRGNGTFIGVVERNGMQALADLDGEMSFVIDDGDADLPPGLPLKAHLVFGDPVVPMIFERPGSARVLRAAIKSAEKKLGVEHGGSNRRFLRNSRLEMSSELPEPNPDQGLRDEYEEFLREALEEYDIQRGNETASRVHRSVVSPRQFRM